jgi:hypothetical protein
VTEIINTISKFSEAVLKVVKRETIEIEELNYNTRNKVPQKSKLPIN